MKIESNSRLDRALALFWTARRGLLRGALRELSPGPVTLRGARAREARPLTPEQYAVLTILKQSPTGLMVQDISRACEFPHANVTRTLERLEKRGLVIRLRSKTDRRMVLVRLTVAGNKLSHELDAIEEIVYHRFWDMFTPDEKDLLLRLLTRRPAPDITSAADTVAGETP